MTEVLLTSWIARLVSPAGAGFNPLVSLEPGTLSRRSLTRNGHFIYLACFHTRVDNFMFSLFYNDQTFRATTKLFVFVFSFSVGCVFGVFDEGGCAKIVTGKHHRGGGGGRIGKKRENREKLGEKEGAQSRRKACFPRCWQQTVRS